MPQWVPPICCLLFHIDLWTSHSHIWFVPFINEDFPTSQLQLVGLIYPRLCTQLLRLWCLSLQLQPTVLKILHALHNKIMFDLVSSNPRKPRKPPVLKDPWPEGLRSHGQLTNETSIKPWLTHGLMLKNPSVSSCFQESSGYFLQRTVGLYMCINYHIKYTKQFLYFVTIYNVWFLEKQPFTTPGVSDIPISPPWSAPWKHPLLPWDLLPGRSPTNESWVSFALFWKMFGGVIHQNTPISMVNHRLFTFLSWKTGGTSRNSRSRCVVFISREVELHR